MRVIRIALADILVVSPLLILMVLGIVGACGHLPKVGDTSSAVTCISDEPLYEERP